MRHRCFLRELGVTITCGAAGSRGAGQGKDSSHTARLLTSFNLVLDCGTGGRGGKEEGGGEKEAGEWAEERTGEQELKTTLGRRTEKKNYNIGSRQRSVAPMCHSSANL